MKENIHIEIDFMWLSIALIMVAFIITSSDRSIRITINHEYSTKAIAQSNHLYQEEK